MNGDSAPEGRRISLLGPGGMPGCKFLTYFQAGILLHASLGLFTGSLAKVLELLGYLGFAATWHAAVPNRLFWFVGGFFAGTSGGTSALLYYKIREAAYSPDMPYYEWGNFRTMVLFSSISTAQMILVSLVFAWFCWRKKCIPRRYSTILLSFLLVNFAFALAIYLFRHAYWFYMPSPG